MIRLTYRPITSESWTDSDNFNQSVNSDPDGWVRIYDWSDYRVEVELCHPGSFYERNGEAFRLPYSKLGGLSHDVQGVLEGDILTVRMSRAGRPFMFVVKIVKKEVIQ